MSQFGFPTIVFILSVTALAIPKPDEPVNKHIHSEDLSDKEHFQNEHHNVQYDHEAFLGEEAKTFDQLTPEESQRRLGLIVDKIDYDKNGFVTQEELKDWIKLAQRQHIVKDVDQQWSHYKNESSDTITWEEYRKLMYGFMDEMKPEELAKEEDGVSYTRMETRDKRRWALADRDGDGKLTKEEFTDFLHPDDAEHMRNVIVLETLEDIDKDRDGKVSLQEYISDMYAVQEGEAEPDWVESEREQFKTYRDKNGDGFMDEHEVKDWILPPNFDHAEAEARHLIYEADTDADHQLTKEEILSKYDLFVGSQATDFGEALARHDEF